MFQLAKEAFTDTTENHYTSKVAITLLLLAGEEDDWAEKTEGWTEFSDVLVEVASVKQIRLNE